MQILLRFKQFTKDLKNWLLLPPLRFLNHQTGFTANQATLLSFITGLFAAYFLFLDHGLFVIFMVLSLFFDVCDGALAQIEEKNGSGWLLDQISDRSVMFLILLKMSFYYTNPLMLSLLIFYLLLTFTLFYASSRQGGILDFSYGAGFVYLCFLFQFYFLGILCLLIGYLFSTLQLARQLP